MTMWHGQHLMAPFVPHKGFNLKVMVSRHRDGEINAVIAEKFGYGTIRASAARTPSRTIEKGGLRGFLEMKSALAEGVTVAMTADLSHGESRRAGPGIIALARASGRPILPIALATSRRLVLENWDRTTINLPFSRGACIFGTPIEVPTDADEALREEKRLALEAELNRITDIAYARVGGRDVLTSSARRSAGSIASRAMPRCRWCRCSSPSARGGAGGGTGAPRPRRYGRALTSKPAAGALSSGCIAASVGETNARAAARRAPTAGEAWRCCSPRSR